jgi:hypothetical protein
LGTFVGPPDYGCGYIISSFTNTQLLFCFVMGFLDGVGFDGPDLDGVAVCELYLRMYIACGDEMGERTGEEGR